MSPPTTPTTPTASTTSTSRPPPTATRRRFLQFAVASTASAFVTRLAAADLTALASTGDYTFFTRDEAAVVEALLDTLIPPGGPGPSAVECGVARFIDVGLAGSYGAGEGSYLRGPYREGTPTQGYQLPLAPHELYRVGLREFDDWAGGFAGLDEAGRAGAVGKLAGGEATLATLPGPVLFQTVWFDTQCGYFADPMYGGNRDMAGWKMVGFPGARSDLRQYLGVREQVELTPLSLEGAILEAREGGN